MKHLTLNLECWIDMEVLDYLMQLDGVDKAEVNEDKDTLDIYFDDKIIPLKILVMEVELFAGFLLTQAVDTTRRYAVNIVLWEMYMIFYL